eukprot:13058960-Alexandrium_andersonii.AAC.1
MALEDDMVAIACEQSVVQAEPRLDVVRWAEMHSAADQLKIFGTVGCSWTRVGKGEMVWIPLGWRG